MDVLLSQRCKSWRSSGRCIWPRVLSSSSWRQECCAFMSGISQRNILFTNNSLLRIDDINSNSNGKVTEFRIIGLTLTISRFLLSTLSLYSGPNKHSVSHFLIWRTPLKRRTRSWGLFYCGGPWHRCTQFKVQWRTMKAVPAGKVLLSVLAKTFNRYTGLNKEKSIVLRVVINRISYIRWW